MERSEPRLLDATAHDWDWEHWRNVARRLHADSPATVRRLHGLDAMASDVAQVAKMLGRLNDTEANVLRAAVAMRSTGRARAWALSGCPALDGAMGCWQRGGHRIAKIVYHAWGGDEALRQWHMPPLAALSAPDPVGDLTLVLDLHFDAEGRQVRPIQELDARLADVSLLLPVRQALHDQFKPILSLLSEFNSWSTSGTARR